MNPLRRHMPITDLEPVGPLNPTWAEVMAAQGGMLERLEILERPDMVEAASTMTAGQVGYNFGFVDGVRWVRSRVPEDGPGATLIASERRRQIDELGYEVAADGRPINDFIEMAIVYLTGNHPFGPVMCRYKPEDSLKRRIEKAGALLAAAIDQLEAEGGGK